MIYQPNQITLQIRTNSSTAIHNYMLIPLIRRNSTSTYMDDAIKKSQVTTYYLASLVSF